MVPKEIAVFNDQSLLRILVCHDFDIGVLGQDLTTNDIVDLADEVTTILLEEFIRFGRQADDEPTPYGLEIEELIDRVNIATRRD